MYIIRYCIIFFNKKTRKLRVFLLPDLQKEIVSFFPQVKQVINSTLLFDINLKWNIYLPFIINNKYIHMLGLWMTCLRLWKTDLENLLLNMDLIMMPCVWKITRIVNGEIIVYGLNLFFRRRKKNITKEYKYNSFFYIALCLLKYLRDKQIPSRK